MTWEDSRASGTVTAVRRSAHSDDAKHRVDDATRLFPGRVGSRSGQRSWCGVLVVVVGGGAAAVLGAREVTTPRPAAEPADRAAGGGPER